jgi:hypothetical protein
MDQISCGEPRPHRASLSDVRLIMTFIHVLMVESLCQVVMGHMLALEGLLPGARGS